MICQDEIWNMPIVHYFLGYPNDMPIVNDDPFSVLWQARGMLQLGAQLHEATALRGSGHRLKKGDRSSGAKI